MRLKHLVKRTPVLGPLAVTVRQRLRPDLRFDDSASYWSGRYDEGGNSGAGSYGALAAFKAQFLNEFVAKNHIQSVVEFGCGDGNQLRFATYPRYAGYDVSVRAVELCRSLFSSDPTKSFDLTDRWSGELADLALSLDVVYHLVEEAVFDRYMRTLFTAARRHVIVYSSNTDDQSISPRAEHVRHRRFTDWVSANEPGWTLQLQKLNKYPYDISNGSGSFSDFFVYERRDCAIGA